MSATNYWYWGDKRMGYRIVKMSGVRWQVQTWLKNRIVRRDDYVTEGFCRKWADARKQTYYGKMSPARAREKYL